MVRDLTDSFINAYEKELAKGTSKDIGLIDDIPNLMLDVVVTAIDTVSTAISWFILYVVSHRDVQVKIHDELNLSL